MFYWNVTSHYWIDDNICLDNDLHPVLRTVITSLCLHLNTLRSRQNGHHFSDDIFKCILFNENVWFFIKISLKFVPTGPFNKIPALVQIMAWCRLGDKPLSEPMMVSLLTHICITRPQWIKAPKVIFFQVVHWWTLISRSKLWTRP